MIARMNRSMGLLCVLLTISVSLFGQTARIDTTRAQIFRAKEDTTKVKLMSSFSFQLARVYPDSSLFYAKKAKRLADSLDFELGKGMALRALGQSYLITSKFDSAIFHLKEALIIFQELENRVYTSGSLLNLGSVYYRLGQLENAFNQFAAAYEIAEADSNEVGMASLLNNMGVLQGALGNNPLALEYYTRSYDLKIKKGRTPTAASTLSNIGGVYEEMEEFDRALEIFEEAMNIRKDLGDKTGVAGSFNNMAAIALKTGNFAQAIDYGKESLTRYEELNLECNTAYPLTSIGAGYFRLQQYDSALHFANLSISRARECSEAESMGAALNLLGSIHTQLGNRTQAERALLEAISIAKDTDVVVERDAAEALSKLYKSRGDFRAALNYHEVYKTAADSIFNASNTKKIAQMEAQYNFDQEKKQIAAEQAQTQLLFDEELKRQAIIRNSVIGGSVLLLILSINFYRSYRNKKRAGELLKSKNAELVQLSNFKESLTHMIAHDMKNPLNAIMGLSKGEATPSKFQTIGQSGKQMLDMVSNMLDVQKFEEAKIELSTTPCKGNDLVTEASFPLELLMVAKEVSLESDISEDLWLDVDRDLVVRVLGNLLSNAIKFSPLGEKIQVIAEEVPGTEQASISVVDHGEGIPADQQKHVFDRFWQGIAKDSGYSSSTGLGLTFCKLAIEAHGGSISVESDFGKSTRFTFTVPLHQGEKPELETEQEGPERQPLILESDSALLSKYIDRLNDLKVHQVGKINAVIKEMEKANIQSQWKQDLVSAMHQGNQKRFNELVDMLK